MDEKVLLVTETLSYKRRSFHKSIAEFVKKNGIRKDTRIFCMCKVPLCPMTCFAT